MGSTSQIAGADEVKEQLQEGRLGKPQEVRIGRSKNGLLAPPNTYEEFRDLALGQESAPAPLQENGIVSQSRLSDSNAAKLAPSLDSASGPVSIGSYHRQDADQADSRRPGLFSHDRNASLSTGPEAASSEDLRGQATANEEAWRLPLAVCIVAIVTFLISWLLLQG